MATVTSRRAPAANKIASQRHDLANELLGLHRRLAKDFERMAVIEAELKKSATDAGESFTETFPKLGDVKVAPGCAAEFKGDAPVIQTEAWLALKVAEKKQLVASGLIKIEPQWGRASSGRVTVKVF